MSSHLDVGPPRTASSSVNGVKAKPTLRHSTPPTPPTPRHSTPPTLRHYQAKAFAYADYCTISFRVVPISILHQMTTSMSSSPACRIAIGTRVRTQLSTLKMNSSGGPRVVGWHELTKGQGEAARGGQASAAQRTHHALWSCVRGDRFCGVTTSSMGRETPATGGDSLRASEASRPRQILCESEGTATYVRLYGLYSIFRQRL